jgi:hypothetical protein
MTDAAPDTRPDGTPASIAPREGAVWTTRALARAVDCPHCGAVADVPCTGAEGQLRSSPHQERHRAAIAAGAPRTKG